MRLPPWKYEDEIEHEGGRLYWQPEHPMGAFKKQVCGNLQYKHETFFPDHLPGPEETDYPLFQGYDLIDTHALPLEVTSGVEETMRLSEWKLDYLVRDDDHRRHLNLALDCGLGDRNTLGLGFCNIDSQEGQP